MLCYVNSLTENKTTTQALLLFYFYQQPLPFI